MIEFDHVTLTYPDATRPVLDDVSFTIPDGDLCLVAGRTGTGKSSLLCAINGLAPHFTGGELRGDVRVDGRSIRDHRPRDVADMVGHVGQNPLAGFVTDTVELEIAYPLEQLGLAPMTMRRRVEESLDLVGLADLRRRPLATLSGGQQQRVAIASVLAAQPRVLVLDEPTSALDPIAAQEVLASITTLVHEVGMTVVLAEHRLERVMHMADKVLWVRGDGQVELGPTAEILMRADVAPPLARIARRMGWSSVPTTVRAARRRVMAEAIRFSPPSPEPATPGESVVVAEGLTVRYGSQTAVNRVDIQFHAGEVTALMGRNGAGKSSLLWALQGALPSAGRIRVAGVDPRQESAEKARRLVALVPQQASDLLYLSSVDAELAQGDRDAGVPDDATRELLVLLGADLNPAAHPRDLSEGQRLSLVLAFQLVAGPKALLLDEPTRGLDYQMKDQLTKVARALAAEGRAVVISTHDVEFAAAVSDRTVIMADGDVVADGPTTQVCTSSPVNSPQVAKVFHPLPVMTPDQLTAPAHG